jgi:hypothetical protein
MSGVRQMDLVKEYFLYLLALSPVFAFLVNEINVIFLPSWPGVLGVFGIGLLLTSMISGVRNRIPQYIIPLILYVLYQFGWDIAKGVFSDINARNLIAYIFNFSWLHLLSVLIIIENTRLDEVFIQRLISIFKLTIIAAFAASLIQFFLNPFFLMSDQQVAHWKLVSIYEIRLNSIFAPLGNTGMGESFIPILSILIGYYLFRQKKLQWYWLIMAAFVVFTNKSRFVYLNFLIILLQYPLLVKIKLLRIIKVVIGIFIAGILLVYLAEGFGYDMQRLLMDRILGESATTRFLAFELFAEYFPKNPIFGTGGHYENDLLRAIGGRSSGIHVGYLAHLYNFGIVGSIMLFGFWFMILRMFYLTAIKTRYFGSFLAFLAFLVANLTLVHYSIYFYGLLFAFVFNSYLSDLETE